LGSAERRIAILRIDMILYIIGNLFQSPAQVLVNTVNTVGVMGKGVAKDFKRLYPEMFIQYRALCEKGELDVGNLWLYKSVNKWVLNFPTKKHWRNPSKVEYIEAGLAKFVQTYNEMGIHSIAFPPLGSGHGQLSFKLQVQPIMHKYLNPLPIDVFIYPDRPDLIDKSEHEQPKEMWEWLRSEPTSLPFSEVWSDLLTLLSDRDRFVTLGRGREFSVTTSSDGEGIRIKTGKKRSELVSKEDLFAFWQQLRTHGFSMRDTKPGPARTIYYLAPIFAELPYVKPVRIADDYSKLTKAPALGLQVLPIAFHNNSEVEQLTLFQNS
jgi:O-acetyl-ADP-ribose deacetylase (regulator of RNase III)